MRYFCAHLAFFFAFLGISGCVGPENGRLRTDRERYRVVRVELPADPVLAERLRTSATDGGCFRPILSENRSVAVPGCLGKNRIFEIIWEKPGTGDADVRVVFGRPQPAGQRSNPVRIPSWDRVWALEIDPTARWVNDPNFRRWLAARIDRRGIARTVFRGRAVPVPGTVGPPGRRPVSVAARPRLALAYPAENPAAEKIASKLRADLLPDQVRVELRPLENEGANRRDRSVAQALRLVEIGADESGPAYERNEIVPLVRREAWLQVGIGLKGVRPGRSWRLDLSRARWKR